MRSSCLSRMSGRQNTNAFSRAHTPAVIPGPFITVVIQVHPSLLPEQNIKILLTLRACMRSAHIALNYSVKNIAAERRTTEKIVIKLTSVGLVRVRHNNVVP